MLHQSCHLLRSLMYKKLICSGYRLIISIIVYLKIGALVNPLLSEFFFFSYFFGTKPKIGSFRLPIYSRDAHRKFFDDPFLNKNKNLKLRRIYAALG